MTILNLYFLTKTLGKISIVITFRDDKTISSGGGLGYGLEIITAYMRLEHESISHVENKK